jgi:hypothetical protein
MPIKQKSDITTYKPIIITQILKMTPPNAGEDEEKLHQSHISSGQLFKKLNLLLPCNSDYITRHLSQRNYNLRSHKNLHIIIQSTFTCNKANS